MTRTALCFGLALMIAPPGAAEPLGGPRIDHFTQSDLDWARVVSEASPLPTGHEWEGSNVAFDEKIAANEALGRSSTNNDTAHYARGSTLVVHVFISHLGGTWDATERNAAGATAYVAKNYFVTNAPANANLTFDHQESTGYVNWQVSLPVNILNGQTGDYIQDAIMALGFTDSDGDGNVYDDFPLWHQSWDGGWDNVICVYQAADITGGAWASYSTATVVVYQANNANVWAHEFGHSFGACDEYVNAGQCNFGIDCGPCQSSYLHQVFNNDNCQLASCPMDVGCLMDDATFAAICPTTLEHWAWVDDDSNNTLDNVRRHISGTNFVWIWELPKNGFGVWNGVTDGFAYAQKDAAWAVTSVRTQGTADYDIHLFQDNNHNLEVASSRYAGTSVDFVVADYNHTRTGNEHFELRRWSGPADDYNMQWATQRAATALPDGVYRTMPAWTPGDVAWVVEVPLFAGETVSFSLNIDSPNLDLGMALYRSNGDTYYAGRLAAEWQADSWGPGGLESGSYTAPADDVYGLVIWSNSPQAGTFGLQIGPTPVTLVEETPVTFDSALSLCTYTPNAGYWSVVGSRGYAGTGTDLKLFDDVNYLNWLETSSSQGAGGVELLAVDYNVVPQVTGHLRVPRTLGTGLHTVEWEHDPDYSWGFKQTETWGITHLVKIWDVLLEAAQPYFFREYHVSQLDSGLFLFGSADGDPYKARSDAVASSDWQSASAGGEWFSYTPTVARWYGMAMIMNNQAAESYSIWHGPRIDLADDVRARRDDEVVFATSTPIFNYWRVYAARALAGDPPDVWIYGDEAYTASSAWVSDQDGLGVVSYVVADYNDGLPSIEYPRFLNTGLGFFDMEVEGSNDLVVYSAGQPVEEIDTWPVDDVAEAWDVWIDADTAGRARIEVEDLSGSMDLGIALFASNGALYYANESSAVATSDAAGPGGTEAFDVLVPGSDWYGLVIYNKLDGTGGEYVLRIEDPAAVSVEPELNVTEFAFAAAPNPFASSAQLSFALPAPDRVDLAIYDVRGRLIRRLADGPYPAGAHAATWDGRDDGGSAVAAGVYLARIQTTGTREVRKLIRLQ